MTTATFRYNEFTPHEQILEIRSAFGAFRNFYNAGVIAVEKFCLSHSGSEKFSIETAIRDFEDHLFLRERKTIRYNGETIKKNDCFGNTVTLPLSVHHTSPSKEFESIRSKAEAACDNCKYYKLALGEDKNISENILHYRCRVCKTLRELRKFDVSSWERVHYVMPWENFTDFFKQGIQRALSYRAARLRKCLPFDFRSLLKRKTDKEQSFIVRVDRYTSSRLTAEKVISADRKTVILSEISSIPFSVKFHNLKNIISGDILRYRLALKNGKMTITLFSKAMLKKYAIKNQLAKRERSIKNKSAALGLVEVNLSPYHKKGVVISDSASESLAKKEPVSSLISEKSYSDDEKVHHKNEIKVDNLSFQPYSMLIYCNNQAIVDIESLSNSASNIHNYPMDITPKLSSTRQGLAGTS